MVVDAAGWKQIRKMRISNAFEANRRDAQLVLSNQEEGVLVLQGGGALGAYQAGVFEALHDAEIKPEWMAGISIGAINSALIAGNPPESRVSRLKGVLAFGQLGLAGAEMVQQWAGPFVAE
jgi:predicted acylesterase/phospholipase RssA